MAHIDPEQIAAWRYEATRPVFGDDPLPDLGPAVEALLAEREEMLALLREVEWVEGDVGERLCPANGDCDGDAGKHAPNCRLAAFLGS